MTTLDEAPVARQRQSPGAIALLALVLTCVVAGVVVATTNVQLVGVAVVACAAFVVCARFWREALCLAFLVSFVEGFFRNYFDSPNVLLVKDALLAAVYVRVFGERILRGQHLIPQSVVNRPLIAFSICVLLQTLNPNVSSIEQALIGVRTWLYYAPLYYVGGYLLGDERELKRFCSLFIAAAVPISLLGIYQYVAGPAAYAQLGPAFARSVFITVEDQVSIIFRPNGTFDWPTGYALFLAAALLLCTANIMATPRAPGRERLLTWAALGVILVAFVLENQRYLFVLVPLLVGVILVLERKVSPTRWIIGLASVVVLGVIFADRIAQIEPLTRIGNILRNEEGVLGVRLETYASHFMIALDASPIGLGAGATSIGSRYAPGGDIPLFVEFSFAKVVGDLSLLGLGVYIWMFLAIGVAGLRTHRRVQSEGRVLASSLTAAVFAWQLLVFYEGYELGMVAMTFWALSGAVGLSYSTSAEPQTYPNRRGLLHGWQQQGADGAT